MHSNIGSFFCAFFIFIFLHLGAIQVKDGSGKAIRESNTRLVKWSDGSTQLFIGDEVS